ncbi:hypothetical protein [Marinobacterium sedimentorum]|uniref:hypothetical protein n=1 Tax=Marinobacterium sedimentorum TaxID=2927804 RepID=UPI0020C65265|nr:hypothetical protein [Marinobacterium sedimentorum]MCP8688780.1 hypothetical protein [Marinobacterium sedimentorum]
MLLEQILHRQGCFLACDDQPVAAVQRQLVNQCWLCQRQGQVPGIGFAVQLKLSERAGCFDGGILRAIPSGCGLVAG